MTGEGHKMDETHVYSYYDKHNITKYIYNMSKKILSVAVLLSLYKKGQDLDIYSYILPYKIGLQINKAHCP